jgi:hypothetical protein
MIISIDFVGGAPPDDPGGSATVAMAATESAGVKAATHWNSAANSADTLTSLALADGTPSGARATWDAPVASGDPAATWVLYFDYSLPGDTRMMNGYLDPRQTDAPATVEVKDLPSPMNSGYDVYVYCYGDIYLAGDTRTAQYSIGSTTHTVLETGMSVHAFPGYAEVTSEGGTGNYLVFRNVSGTSFKLTAHPGYATLTGLHRAPVNGIQIVYPSGS